MKKRFSSGPVRRGDVPAPRMRRGAASLCPGDGGTWPLMRTMGVDTGEGGAEQLHVTVSSGRRARGLQGEAEPPLVLSAERESISSACLAMQGLSDSYVFFGYVDQLLVGDELARTGLRPVLDYFGRDVELGLGAQLWLIRDGSAQEAVESGGEEGVDGRLSTLQTDGKLGVAAISRTAGEVYTDLLEQGAAFVPALMAEEAEDASPYRERVRYSQRRSADWVFGRKCRTRAGTVGGTCPC